MLSVADFAVRTILPKADIDALTQLAWRYGGDTYASGPNGAQPEAPVGSIPASGAPGATLPAPALTAALLSVDAGVASNDPNFATFNVYKRTAGGARVLLATATTKTSGGGGLGDLSAGVLYALALQGGAPAAYGDQITAEIVKSGTGVVLPSLTLLLPYSPHFILARLLIRASQINARLKKRYAVPFADPVPEIALGWQEALVTLDCYRRRGYATGSEQDGEIKGRADEAEAQLREAADSKDGLFELPLLQTAEGASGVSAGGPLAYTETSPYVWADRQADNATREDVARRGTGP